MKRQYRVFEDAFLRKYKDKTPQEILEAEGKKALATISRIRELGIKEENNLKAAIFVAERAFPNIQKISLEGNLIVEVVSYKEEENGEAELQSKEKASS